MPRERDLSFEKLAEVCGVDITALTPTTRGAMNAALKDIRLASPGLDDADLAVIIDGKAATYVKVMDGALLTPTALSKHWAALDGMLAAQKRAAPVTNAEAPRVECDTCDGLRFVLAFYRNPGVRTPDQYDAVRHGHVDPLRYRPVREQDVLAPEARHPASSRTTDESASTPARQSASSANSAGE